MKLIITLISIISITLLSSPIWSETIEDLVKRDGLFYKKFTNTPFTGEVSGIESGDFKNGTRIGEWLFFHENGQLHLVGKYKDGKKDGLWKSYHKNGQLWTKGKYKNGNRHGKWEWYNDNGQFIEENYYNNGKFLK